MLFPSIFVSYQTLLQSLLRIAHIPLRKQIPGRISFHFVRHLLRAAIGILLLFSVAFSFAQDPQEYIFNHRSINDGLASNFVNCIFRDKKGFLWVGSETINHHAAPFTQWLCRAEIIWTTCCPAPQSHAKLLR
ncbi:MAG: hypothetical protein EOO10_24045 [Chitinophagaceae bacterium]|nr:MAG: hypothetical protein EOO10_24045 [Chitinophagaceae bacterium]